MEIYKKEISHNISSSIINDMICSVISISNDREIKKVILEKNEIDINKKMMSSQINQINGQKQIISNLNKTINDLYDKINEYEHHIKRLTLQIKQLSLINKASQQTNTDFNVQQIQILSNKLMTKEIQFDDLKKEYLSKLKQNEYSYKLTQKSLKEKYEINFNKFNNQYISLQNKYKIMENRNNCSQNEIAKYHELMIKYKEENNLIINKYKELQNELNKNQNTNKILQNEIDSILKPQINKYENKIRELYEYHNNHNNHNKNNNNDDIIKYKKEINRLKEQLYEGSNIRNELRSFISSYQREGQTKINKIYTKLTNMKKLVLSTYTVLNEEKEFIHKNNVLRKHLEYLTLKLQENQENINTNKQQKQQTKQTQQHC